MFMTTYNIHIYSHLNISNKHNHHLNSINKKVIIIKGNHQVNYIPFTLHHFHQIIIIKWNHQDMFSSFSFHHQHHKWTSVTKDKHNHVHLSTNIHAIHIVKYEIYHIDTYAWNVLDTTLHACGTTFRCRSSVTDWSHRYSSSLNTFTLTWPCMHAYMTQHRIYSYTITQVINNHQHFIHTYMGAPNMHLKKKRSNGGPMLMTCDCR